MIKSRSTNRKAHGCPTGKKRFRDHRAAVSFLHHAQNARHTAYLDGVVTKLQVIRAYECSACRGFHLTSQTPRVAA